MADITRSGAGVKFLLRDLGAIGLGGVHVWGEVVAPALVLSDTPLAYRTAVVAADVLAPPGTVTCTKLNGVGSCTAGAYAIVVVGINAHGRTTGKNGDAIVTTETTNLGIRAAFAQLTGATHYGIYCSVATAGLALFVGRITEVQRASGIIIDSLNHTTAGGTAGAVDIYVPGTGLAANTSCAVNYAYVMPATPIDCTGKTYCDFLLDFSRTGDIVAAALTVVPAILNSRTGLCQMCNDLAQSYGGPSGMFGSMQKRIRVEVRGEESVALVVESMAGTGASLNVDYVLS